MFVSVSGPEATKSSLKWAAPQAETIDPGVDSVIFQQIDMDYYVGKLISCFTYVYHGVCFLLITFSIDL